MQCHACGKSTPLKCTGCLDPVCSIACQAESWPTHKVVCNAVRRVENLIARATPFHKFIEEGVKLHEAKKDALALILLTHARDLAPKEARVHELMGLCKIALADYQGALEEFEIQQACAKDPVVKANALSNQATIYNSQGKQKEAIDASRLALAELNEAIPMHRGKAHMNLGILIANGQEALSHFISAANEFRRQTLNDDLISALNAQGLVHIDLHQYELAYLAFSEAKLCAGDHHAQSAAIYSNMAFVLHQQDHIKEARAMGRRAIAIATQRHGITHGSTRHYMEMWG